MVVTGLLGVGVRLGAGVLRGTPVEPTPPVGVAGVLKVSSGQSSTRPGFSGTYWAQMPTRYCSVDLVSSSVSHQACTQSMTFLVNFEFLQ
jgi:hypothetical protein